MRKTIVVSVLLLLCAAVLISGCEKEPTWQELYDAGIQSTAEKDYEQAISYFEEAIALDAGKPEAYSALADVYIAMDDLEKALEVLQRGVKATNDESLKARVEEITAKLEELAGPTKPENIENHLDFIRSVLCAVNYDSFADGSKELNSEDVFGYIENLLNSSYIYFETADFLSKHETDIGGGAYYSLSEEEANQAATEIFGTSFKRDANLSNLAIGPDGGWNSELSAFLFPVTSGRGKYAEVILDSYSTEDDLIKVSYTFNRYETADASLNRQPTSTREGAATFRANSTSSQYPYQIISNGKSFAATEVVASSPLLSKLTSGIWIDFRAQDIVYTKYEFNSDFTGSRNSYAIDTGEEIGSDEFFTYTVNESQNTVSITTADCDQPITNQYQYDGQNLSMPVSYSDIQEGDVSYTITIYYYSQMPDPNTIEAKWMEVNNGY